MAATATFFGSATSFLFIRRLAPGLGDSAAANNPYLSALSRGDCNHLLTLIMIRLCPLPYSSSNGGLAAFPDVKLSNFVLATAIASPKLAIPVFVGSRLAVLGGFEATMSPWTKTLEWATISFSVFSAFFISWVALRVASIRCQVSDSGAADGPVYSSLKDSEAAEDTNTEQKSFDEGTMVEDEDSKQSGLDVPRATFARQTSENYLHGTYLGAE